MRYPFSAQISRGWLVASGAIAIGIVVVDASTPPDLVLSPLYLLPIAVASSRGELGESLGAAFFCGLCAAAMDQYTGRTNVHVDAIAALSQSFAWLTLFSAVAVAVSSWVQQWRMAAELETLRGMLPVCAWCKRIRDDERGGEWDSFQHYLHVHAHTSFTHGICPTCAARARAEILQERGTPA